jgi:hypothetical protein
MAETAAYPYATHLDIKFDPLTLIDVSSLAKTVTDQWYNQTLCKVNESVTRQPPLAHTRAFANTTNALFRSFLNMSPSRSATILYAKILPPRVHQASSLSRCIGVNSSTE